MRQALRRRRRQARHGAAAAAVWSAGWYRAARPVPSPNVGTRPAGAAVTLAVVHAISLPPGVWGGDAIERFFTNRLDPAAHPYFAGIATLQVSAHFLIRRTGEVVQFAAVDARAWHAGRSAWRGRADCNDWSLGVELEGLDGLRFTTAQYQRLAWLLRDVARAWPVAEVVGHEHVAPGRKNDPGPGFDWLRLAGLLRGSGLAVPPAEDDCGRACQASCGWQDTSGSG
jgi:AmpD protein